MIKNERQFRITKAQAEKFRAAIRNLKSAPAEETVHPLLRKAEIGGLLSQLADLEQDIDEYNDLRSGRRKVIKMETFEDLPRALIQARIATGLTQDQLAAKLRLKPQQIQRYESTEYQSASLARICEVVRALGLKVKTDILSPEAESSRLDEIESRSAEPQDPIDEEVRARELAKRMGLPFIKLENFEPDHDLFRSVPVDLMFRYGFLPYRRENGKLVLVTSEPTNQLVLDELALLLNAPIQPAVGTESGIQKLLMKSQSTRVQGLLEEASESFKLQMIREGDEGEETLSIDRLTTEEKNPIINLVDSAIYCAVSRRASDIHIETRDEWVLIKHRIDGVPQRVMKPLPRAYSSEIVSRIKVMAKLDIAEKRVPQDGRFRLRVKGRPIDFRVSIMPRIHGEDAVIRILDKESISEQFKELRLDILGFSDQEVKRIRRFIREPYGMVLVTGPTGSGKTTTLYAALSEIYNEEDTIVTIEDPVEYQLRGITQIAVNEEKGLTFARGLRSIHLCDPDKIMVGEIRDPETAQIAIQSALTGHLVFTTVHANNVIDVIGRFLNMGVEPHQFVSSLNCILAQRLVRVVCPFCKQPFRPSAVLLAELGLDIERYRDFTFYRGTGCLECSGTGYKGRSAICELLDLSDRIREVVIERRPSAEIERAATEEGMIFLRESALAKAFAGITTLEEVSRVIFPEAPEEDGQK